MSVMYRMFLALYTARMSHEFCMTEYMYLIFSCLCRHALTCTLYFFHVKVKTFGILVGMSLVIGGSGFPYFAPAMYSYLSGQDVCSIVAIVDEVPNAE